MKARSFVSLLLAALMLTTSLASCANNEEEKGPKETAGESVNAENDDDVPTFEERDFDEAEFKFLYYGTTATDYVDEYIWTDGVSGSAISDAVGERNRKVEERYNVVITAEECGPIGEATKRMQAGQCDFDMIYEWGSRSKGAAMDGMLEDYMNLSYIDLDQSYWLPSTTEDLTVGGRMFIGTNYITMNGFSWANFQFFNKELMDKIGYEYPYEYVEKNEWTFDVFAEMIIGAEEDLDGDGFMTPEDQFGYGGDPVSTLESFVKWSGQQTTVKNDDGTYELSINTEKARNIYETYHTRLELADTYITYEDVWDSGADTSGYPSQYVAARFLIFGEDHSLFMSGTMDITKEFTNMDSEYGVAPNPKYNSAQEEYYHWVDTNAPMLTIPIQAEDMDMVAIILEYMAYESEQELLPAYYETTIKTKRMEVQEDYDMIDIIRNSVHYDWTGLYNPEGVGGILNKMLTSGNFASVYKRYESKAIAGIEELLEEIESLAPIA